VRGKRPNLGGMDVNMSLKYDLPVIWQYTFKYDLPVIWQYTFKFDLPVIW
jgi:hypothetical protein